MTDTAVSYIFFLLIAVLIILAFIIGNEKMIKVLLGNYVLAILCLASNQGLESLALFLSSNPSLTILNISYDKIANFITMGKTTIVMIIYLALLFIIYQKSKIKINLPGDEIAQKLFSLFLVPMTVVSLIITLEIVILGAKSFDPEVLKAIAAGFTNNVYITQVIMMTPLWILIHSFATILITTEIKIAIKTDLE